MPYLIKYIHFLHQTRIWHAIPCIWYNGLVVENFVSSYYRYCSVSNILSHCSVYNVLSFCLHANMASISCCRKSQCLVTYSHIVLPSNGRKLWPDTNTEHINPPAMRRSAGRPKKLRKKSNDEPVRNGNAAGNGGVLPRQLKTVKCMKYNKYVKGF